MSKLLNEKESINILESLGFSHSTFEEHEKDCTNPNFLNTQFDPFECNIFNLRDWAGIRKFYIVKLSQGRINIRAWRVFV